MHLIAERRHAAEQGELFYAIVAADVDSDDRFGRDEWLSVRGLRDLRQDAHDFKLSPWNTARVFRKRPTREDNPVVIISRAEQRALESADEAEQDDKDHRDHADSKDRHRGGSTALEHATDVVPNGNHATLLNWPLRNRERRLA
ncbi:MAG TPA: hypothetical protein VMV27_14150 [Candidatus Binataceae bacterium]|nr:hypothetical protein [Candidatus Binataceae bacterium]